MRQTPSSDDIIEALVILHCGQHGASREKHLYRESLRSLVRLAQAEKAETARMEIYALSAVLDDESVVH